MFQKFWALTAPQANHVHTYQRDQNRWEYCLLARSLEKRREDFEQSSENYGVCVHCRDIISLKHAKWAMCRLCVSDIEVSRRKRQRLRESRDLDGRMRQLPGAARTDEHNDFLFWSAFGARGAEVPAKPLGDSDPFPSHALKQLIVMDNIEAMNPAERNELANGWAHVPQEFPKDRLPQDILLALRRSAMDHASSQAPRRPQEIGLPYVPKVQRTSPPQRPRAGAPHAQSKALYQHFPRPSPQKFKKPQ